MDAEAIRRYVKEQIAFLKEYQVQASEVGDDQPLFSDQGEASENCLELDSLDAVELAMAVENEYNLGTPEDIDMKSFRTVDDIVAFVVDLLSEQPHATP